MKRHSKDAFSREPEVGVVTAKTTYHTKSTQVPLHKVQKKKQKTRPKTVICTIAHNLFKFHTNYKIFQQSVYTVGPSHNSQKKKKHVWVRFSQVNNSDKIMQIASNLKCFTAKRFDKYY